MSKTWSAPRNAAHCGMPKEARLAMHLRRLPYFPKYAGLPQVTVFDTGGTVSRLPPDFLAGSPERVPLPISFRFYCIDFPFPASKVCVDGQDGLCHVDSGCDLSSQTLRHIVVATRVQYRREVKFLRKELIAEGF